MITCRTIIRLARFRYPNRSGQLGHLGAVRRGISDEAHRSPSIYNDLVDEVYADGESDKSEGVPYPRPLPEEHDGLGVTLVPRSGFEIGDVRG